MKKVLIITYYWPPSGGAGVQRWLKFVKYLREFGYEPVILTVNENYASYPLTDPSLLKDIPENIEIHKTKSFEVLELYKYIFKKKNIPHSGFANENTNSISSIITRFIRGNFLLPDARKGWNKYAYKKACDLIINNHFEAIITTSPPHSTHLIGKKLQKKFKIKWIADLRDPWTDIYYYNMLLLSKPAKYIDKKMEKSIIDNADKIITVSPSLKRLFLNKSSKINPNKIEVIPNGFDETDFIETESQNQCIKNKPFTITYTGTISDSYYYEGFINACKTLLIDKNTTNLKIQFIGKHTPNLTRAFSDAIFKNKVEFINYLPHNEAIQHLINSDLLLLLIPKIKNNEGILTGKLFEYIGSNKPILCIGPPNGDAAKIINECRAGVTFDYDEVQETTNFLNEKINKNDLTNIATNYSQNYKYSRRTLTKILAEIIDQK